MLVTLFKCPLQKFLVEKIQVFADLRIVSHIFSQRPGLHIPAFCFQRVDQALPHPFVQLAHLVRKRTVYLDNLVPERSGGWQLRGAGNPLAGHCQELRIGVDADAVDHPFVVQTREKVSRAAAKLAPAQRAGVCFRTVGQPRLQPL